jgi:hypothetical protein
MFFFGIALGFYCGWFLGRLNLRTQYWWIQAWSDGYDSAMKTFTKGGTK